MMAHRVGVLGGSRIPFCRSHTAYSEFTNLDLLTAALTGLVERFDLRGAHVDEVVGGAVLRHSGDWNLAREAVIGSKLSPTTPGITMMQACGTSLQAALVLGAKIATGQIDCGIAIGSDTTSDVPLALQPCFAKRLGKVWRSKSICQKLAAFKGFSLTELAPLAPSATEPRTNLSLGEHCELMTKEWGISREDQDLMAYQSHKNASAAYSEGFMDDLVVPCAGVSRDNNIRENIPLKKMAGLKPVYDRLGSLTVANSTPLTDGAATVLLGSEQWAKKRGIPVQAYLRLSRTTAVEFLQGEGLLIAPAVAVSELLRQTNLRLQDFDYYEIHEGFAAQLLATLKAWETKEYCRRRLGRNEPLGSIDRAKLNVKGSALAFGHPFAATGARMLAVMAKLLGSQGGGRGLITLCTGGGMGVAAILEGAQM